MHMMIYNFDSISIFKVIIIICKVIRPVTNRIEEEDDGEIASPEAVGSTDFATDLVMAN